jgi:hypothetical protein
MTHCSASKGVNRAARTRTQALALRIGLEIAVVRLEWLAETAPRRPIRSSDRSDLALLALERVTTAMPHDMLLIAILALLFVSRTSPPCSSENAWGTYASAFAASRIGKLASLISLRLPEDAVPAPERRGEADLVIMNTAGGLAGGDRLAMGRQRFGIRKHHEIRDRCPHAR